MFSSYEAQGLRDRRLWGLWSIYPDGRNWGPLMSAMKSPEWIPLANTIVGWFDCGGPSTTIKIIMALECS